MGKIIQKMILLLTGFLILSTSLKVILGAADSLDRMLALLTLIVFFGDQITR